MNDEKRTLTPQILAFYLGTKFRYRYVDWEKDTWSPWTALNGRDIDKMQDLSIDKIQLQLRRLSDMNNDEREERIRLMHGLYSDDHDSRTREQRHATETAWLLSKSFDLFGLIDSGLAIDQKTLKL